jgi:histidine triad (HIT) family protein
MADDCLFCRIIAREIPADVVYEDAETLAFRDINPQAPVHVLVVPRRHMASLNAVSDTPIFEALFASVRTVAQQEGVAESGFRSVINTGPDAQQSVQHVHIHVLGGRPLGWPPG